MPTTVPNQKVVHIHRDMPKKEEGNFLLIKKDNLYAAYRYLSYTALYLYLYLAGNKDGFDLALSPKAVFEATGMPESTCRDQIKVLIQRGYLVQRNEGSNIYDFYEKPVKSPNGPRSSGTSAVFDQQPPQIDLRQG